MSTHLLIAAAYLEDLPQGTKLVLMAVADSADEHTLDAAPGLPKLRAWSGLSKSQVLRTVAQLAQSVDDGGLGYLERVEAGRFGRRAVYRVFPRGVPGIPHPSEVAARYAPSDDSAGSRPCDPSDLSESVDNPESYPQVPDSQGRTGATHRVASDAARVAPVGPLHASTSVLSSASASSNGSAPVDRPASRPSTASGFPGARQPEQSSGDTRSQRGHYDQPCPFHPDQIMPCRRCVHLASKIDPEVVEAAKERARELLHAATARPTVINGTDTTPPTAPPTEENHT